MTLFNAKDAVDDMKERRAVAEANAAAKPKKLNPFQIAVAENKALKEENQHLKIQLKALTGRVDEHDSRLGDQEQWYAEAQKRVDRLETITGGASQRQCPGCLEMRHDGPESFPGYLEDVARADEPEYHAWRQLCAVCRDGKQAPGHG